MSQYDLTVEIANKVIEAMVSVIGCQRAADAVWRKAVESGDYNYTRFNRLVHDRSCEAISAAKIAISDFIKVTDIGEMNFTDCE